jgi:uncharacterized membrane protein
LSPLRLLLFVAVAGFLVAFVQLDLLRIAFDKLGLAPESAGLLLGVTLMGSLVNLPLFTLKTDAVAQQKALRRIPRVLLERRFVVPGKTIIAVNVGGCLVPVWFSVYLFIHNPVDPLRMLLAIVAVTLIAYRWSFSVAGVGIVMPIFIAPIVAALVGVALDPAHGAVLAYIGGTGGCQGS